MMGLFSRKASGTPDSKAELEVLADTVITLRDADDFSGRRISGEDVQQRAAAHGVTVTRAEADAALKERLRHRGIR